MKLIKCPNSSDCNVGLYCELLCSDFFSFVVFLLNCVSSKNNYENIEGLQPE